MAKQICRKCGVEVGFLQQLKLNDGNFLCRKCAKLVHPLYGQVQQRSYEKFEQHPKQLEDGAFLWEKLFIPRLKPADKSIKLKNLIGKDTVVAKDLGLIAFKKKKGGIFIFGGTWYYMVFRLADLERYEYTKVAPLSLGKKEEAKHYIDFSFIETPGCDDFKVGIASVEGYKRIAKYLNECFGIQRDLKNIGATWKNQIRDVKAAAKGLKAAFAGDTEGGLTEVAKALRNQLEGDRTELAAKADAAIKATLY
jgi:hypothetical protein